MHEDGVTGMLWRIGATLGIGKWLNIFSGDIFLLKNIFGGAGYGLRVGDVPFTNFFFGWLVGIVLGLKAGMA